MNRDETIDAALSDSTGTTDGDRRVHLGMIGAVLTVIAPLAQTILRRDGLEDLLDAAVKRIQESDTPTDVAIYTGRALALRHLLKEHDRISDEKARGSICSSRAPPPPISNRPP